MSRTTAATPQTKTTEKAPRVLTPTSKAVDPVNGGASKSPAESKTPDPAASLSARMGNMVLLDKEAEGMVFSAPEPRNTTKARWAVVGKSCSSRPLNLAVLEKTMQRAWGLHKAARFRDLGGNVFEVHFGSEGDWRHVLHNGPWQYDFSILIVKEYDGGTRPSEMVFDKVDIWIQVQDLPPDRRTEEFGNALGNWLGKVVRVDVDEEGKARGQHLRVRAQISVFEPLVRGFFLKSSVEEKSKWWFDFHYKKIPHFCFECDRLVHVEGVCGPPVDSSSQWGAWLRASSEKHNTARGGSQGAGGGSNNSQSSGRQGDSDRFSYRMPRVHDLQTKRNLHAEFSCTGDSRTGVEIRPERKQGMRPNNSRDMAKEQRGRDLRLDLEQRREEVLRGKLVDEQQQRDRASSTDMVREGREIRTPPKATPVDKMGRWLEGLSTRGRRGLSERTRGRYTRRPR
ncbi:hypothetical protein ZWY2020_041795 [Hordeum vulgare]|nr:hypothetical protein ZWY2020_041795 [Hordeum vulgare]